MKRSTAKQVTRGELSYLSLPDTRVWKTDGILILHDEATDTFTVTETLRATAVVRANALREGTRGRRTTEVDDE